jgi:hypothetical protein
MDGDDDPAQKGADSMNYHSNIPANRAAVNQEKLFRQVAVILPRVIFELGN